MLHFPTYSSPGSLQFFLALCRPLIIQYFQFWPESYIYGVYTVFFGREITKYTVIYGVYIRFWPTLSISLSVPAQPTNSSFCSPLPTHPTGTSPRCLDLSACEQIGNSTGTGITGPGQDHTYGQNHIHTVHIRQFLQGFNQIYGHIQRMCTDLANPTYLHTYSAHAISSKRNLRSQGLTSDIRLWPNLNGSTHGHRSCNN